MGAADVTFVLPGLISSGGVRAVFEIADHLRGMGLETAVVVPERSLWPPRATVAGLLSRALPAAAAPSLERIAPPKPGSQDWFPLHTPVRAVPAPLWRCLSDERCVIATSWRTAEEVARWPRAAERSVYLIQHHETWSGPARRVDATWREARRMIVTSEWLRRMAVERFGKREVGLAVYGVDHEVFKPADGPRADGPGADGPRVVGFMWDPREWKGGVDVLAALQPARAAGASVRAFGLGDASGLPGDVEFLGPLSGEALAGFYRSLDVFVSGSWSESGPMTVPEAMACGVQVVTTDVGNVRVWDPEERALHIVQPRHPASLAAALATALAAGPEERERRITEGMEAIAPFTWRRTAEDLLASLRGFGLVDA